MKARLEKIFSRVRTASDADALIYLFFGMLFVGLFFGDGKQAVVEVYGAATVLILWFFHISRRGFASSPLPREIMFSWFCVFVVVGISACFSDSIGFSLSWIVRLLSGYLSYRLFYDIASEKTEGLFVRGLLSFVFAASIAAAAMTMFPELTSALPSMNLVSKSFGHNHLADLLVFVSPLVWTLVSGMPTWRGIGVVVLFGATLSATLARASVVLVSLYYAYMASVGSRRHAGGRVILAASLAVIIGVFYFGKGSALSGKTIESVTRPRSALIRLEYWRQATEGFISRPFLGNGPGAFSFVSSRYQRTPLSASWFAHSQPFQILAEMGVLGLVVFGALVFFHARFWYMHRKILMGNPRSAALIAGCALILVYSLFEFVLDYFLVWLLFFSVVGVISGRPQVAYTEKRKGGTWAALIVVSVFYIFWISSNGVGLFTKRHDLAFYLAPFDSVQTLLYLDERSHKRDDGFDTSLALLFHKKNAQILAATARTMKRTEQTQKEIYFSREAAIADPQNMALVWTYLSLLASGETAQTGDETILMLGRALPLTYRARINDLMRHREQIGEAIRKIYVREVPPLQEGYVSLLYLIGLQQMYAYPELTELLWSLAKDIHPDFASIHIELAMFYQHIEHDNEKAQQILEACVARESPGAQCAHFLDKEMLPPGDFYAALR